MKSISLQTASVKAQKGFSLSKLFSWATALKLYQKLLLVACPSIIRAELWTIDPKELKETLSIAAFILIVLSIVGFADMQMIQEGLL